MDKFQDLDQYRGILQNRGYDLTDRDAVGRPRKVSLRDWLDVGKRQLSEQMKEVQFQDTISTPDITPWLPQVIEQGVLETIEPLLVLTDLFEKVPYEAGQVIEFPAIGAVGAADIAEGDAYPLVRLQESGATVRASVGKCGVAFQISEEALNHSRFDVMGMHLRACAKGLARHKEVKAARMLNNLGTVAFDNYSPTSSMFGVTTGRAEDGTANGSLVLDNLFDAFALVMMQGFMPNTLIMHPLTFVMFMKDPVLRAVTLAGGNQVWFGNWTGNAAMTRSGSRRGVSGGQRVVTGGNAASDTPSTLSEYNQALTSAPVLPGRWAWPLRIVVSPFIPFDPATKRTNIILADGSEIGFYIEEHGVKVDRWQDLSVDSTMVKLKERYSFHIANEGLGIAIMKNVSISGNQVNFPSVVTHSMSGSLSAVPPTTPV
jgi:hypothetical protein